MCAKSVATMIWLDFTNAITALPCAKANSSQLSFVTVAVSVCPPGRPMLISLFTAPVFTASTVPEN